MGLAERKEFHGFSVDKKNVFEIDGRARFLRWPGPLPVRTSRSMPTYSSVICPPMQNTTRYFTTKDSVDSPAHCRFEV